LAKKGNDCHSVSRSYTISHDAQLCCTVRDLPKRKKRRKTKREKEKREKEKKVKRAFLSRPHLPIEVVSQRCQAKTTAAPTHCDPTSLASLL
jgi:hypothetical protein